MAWTWPKTPQQMKVNDLMDRVYYSVCDCSFNLVCLILTVSLLYLLSVLVVTGANNAGKDLDNTPRIRPKTAY